MNIRSEILEQKDYLIGLRRYFHMHPEVSLQEFGTAKRIEEELDKVKIPHRRVGETGVYAWIDGTKKIEVQGDAGTGREAKTEKAEAPEKGAATKKPAGKAEVRERQSEKPRCIALRADMDALPMEDLKTCSYRSQNEGVCHACGHDAHTAMLLTAAKVLKGMEQTFSGQIRLFFQQAEEIGAGARQFVNAGLMDGVGRVFGEHVAPMLPSGSISITPGPNNASCDYFKITVLGKGAHVSTPQNGIDAAYIASQIVVNLQSIVARLTDPIDTVVVGVGRVDAGTAYNIVAERAVIEGTTRSFSHESREKTNRSVQEIAEGIGRIYGAGITFELKDYAAPLINDRDAAKEATKAAEQIWPKDAIIHDQEKRLVADDFADYLAKAKGVYAFLGTQTQENSDTAAPQHNGHFDVDEKALLGGANLYVDYALWYLREGEELS